LISEIFISGVLSWEYRPKLEWLLRKEDREKAFEYLFTDAQIDSIARSESMPIYPYKTSWNYFFRSPSLLTEIADSFYALPLHKIIHFEIIRSSGKPRILDYFTEYMYHHQCDYQLEFDGQWKL
jgi:hypothetical protein